MGTFTLKYINKALENVKEYLGKLKRFEKAHIKYINSFGGEYPSPEPKHDLHKIQEEIEYINGIIRGTKSIINACSTIYFVPEYNMTLDELEMYYRDLSHRCSKLSELKDKTVKARLIINGYQVLHTSINYDKELVTKEYEKIKEECSKIKDVLSFIYENAEFEVDGLEFNNYEDEELYAFYDEEDIKDEDEDLEFFDFDLSDDYDNW